LPLDPPLGPAAAAIAEVEVLAALVATAARLVAGNDRSGVGLGLSISRRAVHAIGGTLEVRTCPAPGCILTINLPLS
jgi:K+-sensing histidine kinase KdpD